MKKAIPYIAIVIISVIITLMFFGAMSWYRFGDVPTPVVLFRLVAFCCLLAAALSIIVYFIAKKVDKSQFLDNTINVNLNFLEEIMKCPECGKECIKGFVQSRDAGSATQSSAIVTWYPEEDKGKMLKRNGINLAINGD